jgi:hypothetical protein
VRALACLLIIAACGAGQGSPAPGPDAGTNGASFGSGSGSGSGSGDCPACACPIEQPCDPARGGSDCTTGCCGAALDEFGQPRHDDLGAPVQVCVTPACLDDAGCGTPGDSCLVGATCADNRCGCATDPDPSDDDDRDLVCCAARDLNGVCCSSGEVDGDGACVCPDPRMVDHGWGCDCPAGLVPGEDGMCRCEDPIASYDAATGACVCPAGTVADQDPYTGQLLCETDPPGCGDPDAHVDPSTGACECNAGFVEGDTASGVTAACVPIGCGDGVCSPGESCATCDFDCPCDPAPDAGVPDAAPVGDAAGGSPDAGVIPDAFTPPDAVVIHADAGVFPDAGAPPDAIVIHADAGVVPDAGAGSGSGHR